MRHSISLTIIGSSRALVISFLLTLTSHPAVSFDKTLVEWATRKNYAICDLDYKTKYFNNWEHQQATQNGILFVPPYGHPSRGRRDGLELSSANFEDNYWQHDHVDGLKKLTQFMDYEKSPLYNFYDMRRQPEIIARNSSVSDEDNLEKRSKSKGRYLRSRKRETVRRSASPRRRRTGGQTAGRFVDGQIRPPESRVTIARINGSIVNEESIVDHATTMGPPLSSMYKSRRDLRPDPKFIWYYYYTYDTYNSKKTQAKCKTSRRIVGGYDVQSAEELPYMVFVDSGCGGAIIGQQWVLTAGHCVDQTMRPTYVHVGSMTLLSGCQYNIDSIHVHPRHTRQNLQHDIALLKVKPAFIFSPAIKPIAMSSAKAVFKSCGIVAGWGTEKYGGTPRVILRMSTIPIVKRSKCKKLGLKEGQFCAGYDDASSDTCQGDSGGPFVVKGLIVGIISYGHKCAQPKTPSVYVDISFHRDWIRGVSGL